MPVTSSYVVSTPAPRAVWNDLLVADPAAQMFQSPEWFDTVLAVQGGTDASLHYELPGGRHLVLPLVGRLPGPLRTEASLPHGWGPCGVLAGAGGVTSSDVSTVFADLTSRGLLRISLRPPGRDDAAYEASLPAAIARTSHRDQSLDLAGGFEEVWTSRFTGKARRAVRKAEGSALVVERDDTGRLIPEFYALYQASLIRWAAQQHEPLALARLRASRRDPLKKFTAVAERLGSALRVYVARRDGKPAAAIVVLTYGRTATYWRGAMDKDLAGPSRANDLLHRLAIEDACERGCLTYEMGDSGASTSLARFKESLGAVSRDYHGYRLERLPLSAWDAAARGAVKRVLRFRDT
jgi:hypothetical protein